MLLYVPGALGGVTGSARAGMDVLISLLATNIPVAVINYEKCELPAQVNGITIGSPEWITPPRYMRFPAQINRYFPHHVAAWMKSKLQGIRISTQLEQADPDLMIFHGLGSHDCWKRFRLPADKKTVMIVQESPGHFGDYFPRNIDWAFKVMKQHSSFIFVSSRCRDEWRALGALGDKESFYIPNGCQEEVVVRLLSQDRAQVRQRLGLPMDRFVAVCIASIQHRKGQDLLLDYFSDLLTVVPDLMIYFVGPIFSWGGGDQLCQRIEESRFGDHLQVLGATTDSLDFIYAADLLVLPARAEAMPLVILEAMLLKTPVIASDVGGIPELIENGETGLLFSQSKPEELVEAFVHMAANPETRQNFAERAHQRYWSNFSRAHQIKRYSEVINKLLV
jgi:glycosyltransferase involved in cell wall biosynthesis